jgi:hypothetical protein
MQKRGWLLPGTRRDRPVHFAHRVSDYPAPLPAWVRHLQLRQLASDTQEGSMGTPKFVQGDTVKLSGTGQLGTISSVHQTGNRNVYSVKLGTQSGEHTEAIEADLELVKVANDDETGLHIRYIT